jgi:hypothetical protein
LQNNTSNQTKSKQVTVTQLINVPRRAHQSLLGHKRQETTNMQILGENNFIKLHQTSSNSSNFINLHQLQQIHQISSNFIKLHQTSSDSSNSSNSSNFIKLQ